MIKLKPWAVGPFELIKHAEGHLRGGGDLDKRMALIGFDNAIEASIITFLSLNPSQRSGRKFDRANVDRWLRNFHSKLEFLEHYVVSLCEMTMLVGRDEIIYYHQLRNELYHNGNGFVPAEAHLLGAREASTWVFDTLFNADSEKILNLDLPPTETAYLAGEKHSATTKFLEAFIDLKNSLDAVDKEPGRSPLHVAANLIATWAKVEGNGHKAEIAGYSDVLKNAEQIRDSIVDGKALKQTPEQLRDITSKLEGASRYLVDHLRDYQSRMVDTALQSTADAVLPDGNGKAGIIYQTHGSGLTMTIAAYIARARLLPCFGQRVVLITDRLDLARQALGLLSRWLSPEGIPICYPLDVGSLKDALLGEAPMVIITTIQKLGSANFVSQQNILVIGYNLNSALGHVEEIFPAATRILFTSIQPRNQAGENNFGKVVGEYDFEQAVVAGYVTPVEVIQRNIDSATTPGSRHHLARDVVEHFSRRRSDGANKGAVVVPDQLTGEVLLKDIAAMRTGWHGVEGNNGVAMLSTQIDRAERMALLSRYGDPEDPLSLLILTKAFAVGLDIPAIETLYVLSTLTQSVREQLRGIVSRKAPGKEAGMIVDYFGQNWSGDGL